MSASRDNLSLANPESGYALLVVMFILALLVISLAAGAHTALSSVQREKEAEMVWRGQQYARGIRLYYSKMRRFPTSLDDLTKPKTGIRFLRQAYKDPMNQVDGSWRLIYVAPSGQLIGSLNQNTVDSGGSSMVGFPSNNPSLSTGPSLLGQGPVRTSNPMNASSFSSNQLGSSGQTGPLTTAGNPNGIVGSSSTSGADQGQLIGGSMDSINIIGGNIIGVGSKVNKNSFIVYQRAKNYRLFEFVWDPSKGVIPVGNASPSVGTPAQNLNGIAPVGTNLSDSPLTPGNNPMPNPGQDPLRNENPPQN